MHIFNYVYLHKDSIPPNALVADEELILQKQATSKIIYTNHGNLIFRLNFPTDTGRSSYAHKFTYIKLFI